MNIKKLKKRKELRKIYAKLKNHYLKYNDYQIYIYELHNLINRNIRENYLKSFKK